MGLFGNEAVDELFGNIFGATYPEGQADLLDDYLKRCEIQKYYELLNNIKRSGRKVFRNSQGKHLIKRS